MRLEKHRDEAHKNEMWMTSDNDASAALQQNFSCNLHQIEGELFKSEFSHIDLEDLMLSRIWCRKQYANICCMWEPEELKITSTTLTHVATLPPMTPCSPLMRLEHLSVHIQKLYVRGYVMKYFSLCSTKRHATSLYILSCRLG